MFSRCYDENDFVVVYNVEGVKFSFFLSLSLYFSNQTSLVVRNSSVNANLIYANSANKDDNSTFFHETSQLASFAYYNLALQASVKFV